MYHYVFMFLAFFVFLSCSEEKQEIQCKSNEKLVEGKCMPQTLECLDGEELVDGQCVPLTASCDSNDACDAFQTCVESKCVNKMRLATFNIYDLKQPNAAASVAEFIKDSHIDLMLVQEVQIEDKEALEGAMKAIGLEHHLEFTEFGAYGGDDGEDYLAVISRYPIASTNTILNGTYADPVSGVEYKAARPIFEVKINVFNTELILFTMHLKAETPWGSCKNCVDKRRSQANALSEYILENYTPESDHIVIAGDANTVTPEGELDFQEGSTMDLLCLKTDDSDKNDFTPVNYTFKKETTHTIFESLIDHIILSPALFQKYQEDTVELMTVAGNPSDHKAVFLDLVF